MLNTGKIDGRKSARLGRIQFIVNFLKANPKSDEKKIIEHFSDKMGISIQVSREYVKSAMRRVVN